MRPGKLTYKVVGLATALALAGFAVALAVFAGGSAFAAGSGASVAGSEYVLAYTGNDSETVAYSGPSASGTQTANWTATDPTATIWLPQAQSAAPRVSPRWSRAALPPRRGLVRSQTTAAPRPRPR